MKLTGILSIASVIAAFATFSTAVSADETSDAMNKDMQQLHEDMQQMEKDLSGERFMLQTGTADCPDSCVAAFEDVKVNVKCTGKDDCTVKLTAKDQACKKCNLTVKQ